MKCEKKKVIQFPNIWSIPCHFCWQCSQWFSEISKSDEVIGAEISGYLPTWQWKMNCQHPIFAIYSTAGPINCGLHQCGHIFHKLYGNHFDAGRIYLGWKYFVSYLLHSRSHFFVYLLFLPHWCRKKSSLFFWCKMLFKFTKCCFCDKVLESFPQ